MPYPNEHACRLHPPSRYTTFRRVSRHSASEDKDYVVIRGKKADGKWEDQAYRYAKASWPAAQARSHCRRHDGRFERATENARNTMTENIIAESKIRLIAASVVGQMREEMFEGRAHLVAPVIALVEGVHNDVYYPAQEIADSVEAWNGVPVPIFHPMDGGLPVSANTPELIEQQSVGRLFKCHFDSDGGKLKGELWIDIAKAEKISPSALSYIRGGGQLEVSTGLYCDEDNTAGDWNGEHYYATLTNFRPDHLALLPGGEGACSWTDGCGVRAASKEGGQSMKDKILAAMKEIGQKLGFVVSEMSHEDLRASLQRLIDGLDTPGWMHFVKDIYKTNLVYEARGNNPSETGSTAMVSKFYRMRYRIKDEEVELVGEAEEVREMREYVPVTAEAKESSGDDGGGPDVKKENKKEEGNMAKNDQVDALIACDRTKFEESDREWLTEQSECRLDKFGIAEAKKDETPAPDAKPTPTTTEKKDDKPEVVPTIAEYVDAAPADYKDTLTTAVNMLQEAKKKVIDAILKNPRNKFTEEQLVAKDGDELTALAELGDVKVADFTGQGGGPPPVDKNQAPPMPPVFERETA